jgi:hypothetical protein
MTENIKKLIKEDLPTIESYFRDLRKHLQTRFPGHRFLAFEPNNQGWLDEPLAR